MESKVKFNGGTISLREPGEMFDSKTGKKRTWTKALKVTSEGNVVTLGRDFLDKIATLSQDVEFQEWSKDLMD